MSNQRKGTSHQRKVTSSYPGNCQDNSISRWHKMTVMTRRGNNISMRYNNVLQRPFEAFYTLHKIDRRKIWCVCRGEVVVLRPADIAALRLLIICRTALTSSLVLFVNDCCTSIPHARVVNNYILMHAKSCTRHSRIHASGSVLQVLGYVSGVSSFLPRGNSHPDVRRHTETYTTLLPQISSTFTSILIRFMFQSAWALI